MRRTRSANYFCVLKGCRALSLVVVHDDGSSDCYQHLDGTIRRFEVVVGRAVWSRPDTETNAIKESLCEAICTVSNHAVICGDARTDVMGVTTSSKSVTTGLLKVGRRVAKSILESSYNREY